MRKLIRPLCVVVLSLVASMSYAATKSVIWNLPADWDADVVFDTTAGYVDMHGGDLQRRYGLGGLGEPDLPTLTFRVAIPSGGSLVGVSAEAEWTPVETNGRLPVPIAEPVPFGAKLVYPAPDATAYGGTYPAAIAVTGDAGYNAGVTMVPVLVTPFRWDGAAKTLSKATSLKVTVTFDAPTRLRLTAASASSSNPRSAKSRALAMTVNPQDATVSSGLRLTTSQTPQSSLGQIIIVSPSAFVELWNGYAAFRKATEAGKDFEYVVKNTAEIYADKELNTVEGDDALAIHHWLETVYDKDREQYVILGAAPKKYSYDRATMIPARYVVNQGSLDQVCDMYYGCMDRLKGGKVDPTVEVWDYDLDGTYMGHANAGGGYSSDANENVDWMMDVPVTRVPLMREVAETSGGRVYRLTAAQIMDHFTNKIAFAESEARFDPPKRWRHVLGGGYLFNSYPRGSTDYLVEGEREFFDGGINMFDANHASPAPDAEACPRDRNFITYSKTRAARHGLINTGGLKTAAWGDLYKAWGEVFDVHCHGWARGADPGTTGGALFATGLFRIYNMALPCESGMYDYCPGGSYGITNCVSMGEAPLLCFEKLGGGLVTFNNTRYGWWGGYNAMSGKMEGLINDAFYGRTSDGKLRNAGEVCVYMHNNCGMYACGNRGGASNLEVVMHGDPLIRISPQEARTWDGSGTVWTTNATDGATWTIPGKDGTHPMDYTTDLTVDTRLQPTTDNQQLTTIFDIRDDLAAARFNLAGDAGATVTLDGAGTFRVTDSFVVTNADVVWRVAGGAGRNGIAFSGARGNVTLPGNAKRYFGSAFVNVNELKVTGGNVTIDTPKGATAAKNFDIKTLSFAAPTLDEAENYNVLRSRTEGLVPADMTIAVVSNRLALQTYNISGGDAANKAKPLFFVTNGYLKVRYNPYWGTEYFVRPTYLTNGHLVGDYDKFGLGRPGSDGYDLYVSGKSAVEGEQAILLNGELRVHLAAGAELEIANAMKDGPHGIPGRLRVTGGGKVRIAKPQAFTGGIVVERGCTLELGVADAVSCDVTVEEGGTLAPSAIPLDGVKTVTVRSGAKLVLPMQTGAGIYQIVDSATSKLVLEEGANVYDAVNLKTPLKGTVSEGYFLLTDNLIYWQSAEGTWRNKAETTADWKDSDGNDTFFTNTMPVVFGPVAGASRVQITLDGDVKPGFMDFRNAGCPYAFDGWWTIALESLSTSYDVTFAVQQLSLNNVFKVLGGLATAGDVQAAKLEVANGGTLHVTGDVTEPPKKAKALRFSFSAAMNASELPAVQELRLFRGNTFAPLPNGTRIRDIAGQEIEITGCNGYAHTYKWISATTDGNETLRALVDGTVSGNNKWWASRSAAPTWFVITFPEPVEPITGYSLCTADAGQKNRNPKTWSVSTSPDGETFTIAGSVANFESTRSSYWLGSGDGTRPNFTIAGVDGSLSVRGGGTLFADGKVAVNLRFEAGATLAVTNGCALEKASGQAALTLPEAEGSVLIDASQAAATETAFPILTGYGLTSSDFLKFRCTTDTAVINLKDGNLYIVTAGIRKSPYVATVGATDGTLAWSGLDWRDGDGNAFAWTGAVNYQTDGAATIDVAWVDGKATTFGLDVGGALGRLAVSGAATDPVTLAWGAALVPRTLDFSGYAGPVTLDYGAGAAFALGYSDFIAGKDTLIPQPSSGSLTIGAGKRAVVAGWGDYAKISGAGTIALAAGGSVNPKWATANKVTGTNELLDASWEITNATDYPKDKEILIGAKATLSLSGVVDTTGYGTYATGLTLADGGELLVGKRDTFNRRLTLRNGGRLLMTADATDSNRALDIFNNAEIFVEGVEPSVFGGTVAKYDAETGDPTVGSGIVALRRPSGFTVTVADGATLRVFSQWGGVAGQTYGWSKAGGGVMAFYRASAQSGDMTIAAGAVRLVNKGQGTTGAIVNQGELQLLASNDFTQTVGNAIRGVGGVTKLGPGTTVLAGANAYSGATAVEAGVLKIGRADALGATARVVMRGGTLDMGPFRLPDYTVDSTYDANFTIRATLTELQALGQVQLVRLGSFADDMTAAEIKSRFEIFVGDRPLEHENFKIVISGGIAEYQPDRLTGYAYPLETTATDSRDWCDYAWFDQEHVAFTNDWADYSSASAVINVEAGKDVTVSFSKAVQTPRLTVRNGGRLTVGGGAATLKVTGMVDNTGSSADSVTFLNFDLGACNIDTGAGETILLPGATGTLSTSDGSVVTITNGTGRGTAVLSEGAELRFLGTAELADLPWCSTDNRTGAWIGYGLPIAVSEAAFGGVGDDPAATYGNFHFQGNLNLTAARFVAGNGNGSASNFRQSGGRVTVTGSGDGKTTGGSTVLLAHWPSTVTYEMSGGEFVVENAPVVFGWDGKVTWTMTGGTAHFRGLHASRVSSHDNTSSFALNGGTLELGDLGLDFTQRGSHNAALMLGGGTIRAYDNATVAVDRGIAVASASALTADAGKLLTVSATVTGDGVLTAGGAGTVRFTGNCAAAKLDGTFQIMVTEAQRTAATSTILFTLPDGAAEPDVTVVDEKGDTATGGNGVVANGKFHWVPSGKYVQPISTTLNGGTVALQSTTWTDAAGTSIGYRTLAKDMTGMELEINVLSDTTLDVDDFKALNLVRFKGRGQLTISNSMTFLYSLAVAEAEVFGNVNLATGGVVFTKVTALPVGATLTVGKADRIGAFGDGPFLGRLVCDGFLPTWAVFTDENRWQGTVTLRGDQPLNGEDKFFSDYGNAKSVVELDGTFDGYLKQAGKTATGIKVTGTLSFSNGYSNGGGFTFNGPLSGNGAIRTSGKPTDVLAFTGDASQYRGSVTVAGGHCVAFGAQADDGTVEGRISVTGTTPVIASGAVWTAANGIVVKGGGVLSVAYKDGTAASSPSKVTVDAGGTLNLVRNRDDQTVFVVTTGTLELNGGLTLNGVPVPKWGYEQTGGTIALKAKAVCILPVKTTLAGTKALSQLAFVDSSEPPQPFTLDELLQVPGLEVDYLVEDAAALTVDRDVAASVVKVLGGGDATFDVAEGKTHTAGTYDLSAATGRITVRTTTGGGTVVAGADTVLEAAGAGTLVIGRGMKATVPSWDGGRELGAGGWLKLTGTGSVPVQNYTVAGATLELAGSHVMQANGQVAAGATLVASGALETENIENGLKPGATLVVAGGKTTLAHRFIVSQGAGGAANVVVTGGELASGAAAGHLYVGGYAGSTVRLDVSGGRFTARYAPFSGDNGVNNCYGDLSVRGGGVFAPAVITRASNDNLESPVADVAVAGGAYNHRLRMGDGGVFEPPAVIPNWFATAVTNGAAVLRPQGAAAVEARGPIAIDKDCELSVACGTLKLGANISGEGVLRLDSGAALDLNGHDVYNVAGCGVVTNSGAAKACVVYTTTFEPGLTFDSDVRIENAYVNVDALPGNQRIDLITRGSGVIAKLDGVRVRVGGVLDRRTWKLTADAKGIEVSVPYSAFLTATTTWDNGNGAGLAGHLTFQNDKNYSIVITNVGEDAKLTFNTPAVASVFKLVSAADRPCEVGCMPGVSLDFGAYDFTEAQGRATLAFKPGRVSVTAGADTAFPAGGDGTLTIPAGASATVGAAFGGYANEGTLRRDYDLGEADYAATLQGGTAATNAFRAVTFTGGMQAAKAVLRVEDGDSVTFVGTAANYGARTTASFDVRGGKVLVNSNAADTWFGNPASTTFRQSGGVFEVTASNHAQNGNVGFMVGYANASVGAIPIDVSGGRFLVDNTSVNFYDPSVVTLRGTGLLRAKGVFSAKSQATVTIADNARFELGSLGWRQNAARLTMDGGMLTTFEDATMENALALGGDAAIGAKADTTLTLDADVAGAHTLTVGNAAANDTGKVVADGARFRCGKLVLAAGTLEVPVGTLTVAVDLAGGTLNLTGLAGAAAYAITEGALTGVTADNVTFNGEPLAAANLKVEGNRLVTTIAIQPFHLALAEPLETSWTNAPWVGANGIPVTPDQWSLVCVATVTTTGAGPVALTIDSPIRVEELYVTNAAPLDLRLAVADCVVGQVDLRGSSVLPTCTVVGLGGRTLDETAVDFGAMPLVVACGTRFAPLTVTSSAGLLDGRPIAVADGAALRLNELATGKNNRIWTVSGAGADGSTLILAAERGLGFNAGSNFTNLTLVVDAADLTKKTYLEQRGDGEVLTDASVDLVITNGSTVIVQGTADYQTVVNVGNLSGDGLITDGGYRTGTLGVNLRSDSTYGGDVTVPLAVTGGHVLTLTGTPSGAVSAAAGTTVRFAPTGAVTPGALAGEGTFAVASGTLRLTPDAASAFDLELATGATLDLLADVGESYALTTGAIRFGEGASVTNNVTVRGRPLVGTWSVNGGTLVRTPATEPFALDVSDDLAKDFTAAAWHGANGIPVASDDWDRTLGSAVVNVAEGARAALTVDRALTIGTLVATNAGTLALGGQTLAGTSLDIGQGATVEVPGWFAPNVAGRGTLVLDAGARETAVAVSGAFDTAKFFGGIRLARGTWDLTGDYPHWYWISADGADAVLRFDKQDLTGYNQNFPDLTIADGASLRVSKRDTFDRKLVLRDGARVTFDADDLNSGRAFDFFSRSSLDVKGTAPCFLGDPETRLGLMAIRRKDFTVTVDSVASVEVNAAFTSGDGASGSLVKAGGGVMSCFRESSANLPLAVNGGTVRYVGNGSATAAGVTVADGAAFEFALTNGVARTFAKSVSGAGELVKSGDGTLTLSAANTHAGGTRVLGGTLVAAHAQALGTGALALAEGAVLALDASGTVANDISGAGSVTVGASGDVALTGTVACPAVAVAEGSGVTLPSAEEPSTFAVTGPGALRVALTDEEARRLDVFTTNIRVSDVVPPALALTDASGKEITALAAFVEDGVVKVRLADATEKLWWNGAGGWTNAVGEAKSVTTNCILFAQNGDDLDFPNAVAPYALRLPENGAVAIRSHWNLGALAVDVPQGLTLTLVGTGATTLTFAGAGTIALDGGDAASWTTEMPVQDANLTDSFTGGLRLLRGQFKATATIRASVPIAIADGAQFFAASGSGEWNNRFEVSGDGWGKNEGAWDRAALRIESSLGGAATVVFVKKDGIVPTIGCHSGTKDIAATIEGTDGFRIVSGNGGVLKFTAPKTQAADLRGTVTLESGDLLLGSNGGFSTGESLLFGDEIVVPSGRRLTLHAWSGKDETLTEPGNHVYVTPAITLDGGTLYFEDGSYILSGDVTVAADSTLSAMYDKGRIIKSLKGDATLTIVNRTGTYENDGMTAVMGGDFAGTVADSANGRTFRFVTVGDALANATIHFAQKGLLVLRGDAAVGTLNNSMNVSGSGKLTVGGGTIGGAVAAAVSLGIDGAVSVTGGAMASDLVFGGGVLDFALNAEAATNVITTGSVTLPAGKTLRDVLRLNGAAMDASWLIAEGGNAIYRYAYETISVNFAGGHDSAGDSPADYFVKGADAVGLAAVPGYAWNNVAGRWKGRATKTLAAGTVCAFNGATNVVREAVSVSATANNTYQWAATTTAFFKGYLDDGNRAQVVVAGLGYQVYDVIVYSTSDTANLKLSPITVNGKTYTFADGTTALGNGTWGATQASTPAYGTNALRVYGLTGDTLTIVGGANANGARGGIAAIQIVNATRPNEPQPFAATVSCSTNFSDIAWTPPLVEDVINTATLTIDDSAADEVVLTFDNPDLTLQTLDIVGARDLWLDSPTAMDKVEELGLVHVTGRITYGWPMAIALGDGKVAYAGGAGTAATPVSYMTGSGKRVDLRGGTYWFSAGQWVSFKSYVTFTNATVNYVSNFGIGVTDYAIGGDSAVTTPLFYTSRGGNRAGGVALGGTASLTVTGTSNVDSDAASAILGDRGGATYLTLKEDAAFTAAGDLLVGRSGGNQTITVDGGVFTACGIRLSAGATGKNALNLNGGRLVLGAGGITSYGTTTMSVNVGADATIAATAAMPITQPVAVADGATLTLDLTGQTEADTNRLGAASGAIAVDVSGREFSDLKHGVLLIAWDTTPAATFEGVGLPGGAELKAEADGLYLVATAAPSVVPEEQGKAEPPTGEGEAAVIKITPNEGVAALDINPPVGYVGKYEIPVSVTRVSGVDINQLIVRSGTFDITAACKLEDSALELDAGKTVQVGDEQIPVRPTLATDKTVEPFVVSGGQAALGVKTIPGLTYQLVRGNAPNAVATPLTTDGAVMFATETSTAIRDVGKPEGAAFYVIRVLKK